MQLSIYNATNTQIQQQDIHHQQLKRRMNNTIKNIIKTISTKKKNNKNKLLQI